MFAFSAEAAALEPWQAAYDLIDLAGFVFEHPMTVINREELEIVKDRITRGVYPQAAVFPLLLGDAEEAQRFVPDPPDAMEIMAGYAPGTNLSEMREWLWRNRHAAYASALAYAYTGEARYAEKAVEILDAWASKGTRFTGYDRGLQLGSWFSGMLYAADLIYDYQGWTPDLRERFKAWWRREVLPHVREVMLKRDNNWKDAGILGVLAAAVVLEDRELLREGLVHLLSYFHERTDVNEWAGAGPRIPGAWKIASDENGVYLPHEVTRNEGSSGVTYTGYALTSAVQALEIARYAGYNLWHVQTPQGVTFQDVIEWYFRWDVLRQPFLWHPNPNRGSTRKNPYEIANNHYDLMPEVREWLRWNRPVGGEQGDEYVTLNKGEMPVAPGEGLAVAERISSLRTASLAIESPAGGRGTGEVEIRLSTSLSSIERAVVQLVRLGGASGESVAWELWNEDRLPERLPFDTRQVPDGSYRLEATATGSGGAVASAAVELEVRNEWRLFDPFDPPAAIFGIPIDRSLTLRATEGLEYASDAPGRFWGDASRRVRREDTEEELIWEAPLLREVLVRLYSVEAEVGPWVLLGVYAGRPVEPAEAWVELEYVTQVAAVSEDGWYELHLKSEVPEGLQTTLFRIRLLPTGGRPDGIQLGEVELRGWYPE